MSHQMEVRSVTAGYGKATVVRDLDLFVDPNEVVALIGPNGAGKTTSLLTIAGFLPPMEGSVHFAGTDITRASPELLVRNGLALIPDDRALLPGLTVRESMRLVRNPQTDALELFPELEPLMDRRCGLLSGGEQQMVAIARALSPRPSLLMVDELSLGLAPMVVARLLQALRRAADLGDTAVLLVEQQVQHALDVSDRAYVLVHGRVVLHEQAALLRQDLSLIESSYMGDVQPDAHFPIAE